MRAKISILLFAGTLCLPSLRATAQTSYPFAYSIYPCGLQRGTTAEVTLSGLHNYNGAYKVLIEGKGVTGEVVVPKDGWPKPDAKTNVLPVQNEVKIKLTAANDAPLGAHEIRVATPRGVSSVAQIVIGDEPEVAEKEPNNDTPQAQEVSLPITINGRIQQGEDADTYKFKAAAGEVLTFSVLCNRLENKIHDLQDHADPMITLRDATGRELAANDDYYGPDPLLSYKFEKAGDYYLQLRDVRYLGNPYWVYRLNITRRPYVTSVLPMAARPGTTVDVTPVGFNLPGGKTARLEIPMGTPMGEQQIQLKTEGGMTNAVPIFVTDLPEKTLVTPQTANTPESITLPAAMNARISKAGENHRYKFHAKAGQMFTFEVEARKFDSRVDSVLTLLNAKEQEITSNDDAEGPDSRIDWAAPAEGDYLLDVRDLHNRGGENFVYLLSAQPVGPDFTLRCDDDKMRLGPGNSGAWYVIVNRKFGFNQPITVEVKGLPAGVTAAPLTIPPGVPQGCLILTCAPGSKVDVGMVEVIGTAASTGPDGKPVTLIHKATPVSEIYIPGGGRGRFTVSTQAVAVAENYDILIELGATSMTLAPGGTAKVDVTIKRAPGYTKPVTLDVYLRHLGDIQGNPLPPGVTLDEGASKTLLGENETKGSIVLKAAADAPPVTNLPIAVLGAVSINFVVKVSYSGPPLLLTVTPKK
jgi:hypothetical protein